MWVLLAIVLAHWAEHLVQGVQVFALDMARPDARGVLGQIWPWLATSEALHYGYAILMLAGLALLRPGMTGRAHTWWSVALWIQVWHHLEHLVLLLQAVTGVPWFGRAVPTSFLQVVVPRVELHLAYNALVFVPMVIGMWYHRYGASDPARRPTCTCSVRG